MGPQRVADQVCMCVSVGVGGVCQWCVCVCECICVCVDKLLFSAMGIHYRIVSCRVT
jgi:hypothetical protein